MAGDRARTLPRLVAATLVGAVAGLAPIPSECFSYYLSRYYVAVPLGNLGGTGACGLGINARGDVTGASLTLDDESVHAFLATADGSMTDLGTLGGRESWGESVNNRGDVTGYVVPKGPVGASAFVYAGGTMTTIGADTGYPKIFGRGINDLGQITGDFYSESFLPDGETPVPRAFLYSDSALTDLGTLGGTYSTGRGINAHGQVTGSAALPGDEGPHAFVWSAGVMTDLGTLGGTYSHGKAINASGNVTGEAALPGNVASHAFLYADGRMTSLGTLSGTSSVGLGINSLNHVVGESWSSKDGHRAFLYSNGLMHDLNQLVAAGLQDGVRLNSATGINDGGQIAANTTLPVFLKYCRAYRLDPLPMAVEYYHGALDHYFATAIREEVAALDSVPGSGWVRTGQSFLTYALDTAATVNVCRFWSGPTFAPKSSHFYTPYEWECSIVKDKPDWRFEGKVFAVMLPGQDGVCEPGMAPLYRLYNNGRSGAPNHRYTTSLATRSEMIAQGWTPEGSGTAGVIGCVPR